MNENYRKLPRSTRIKLSLGKIKTLRYLGLLLFALTGNYLNTFYEKKRKNTLPQ